MPVVQQEATDKFYFQPPLWQQRRSLTSSLLLQHAISSVLDVGCGEGSLLQVLLNETSFTQLAGVDIDLETIQLANQNCQPRELDYSFLREAPVQVELYQGSLVEVDERCFGYDAITCIEVMYKIVDNIKDTYNQSIEHLPADQLSRFPSTIFGVYAPKIVIISTPNAEFNIHFPNLKYGTPEAQFRHDDHKFEWTRQEFVNWTHDITLKYPYTVEIHQVGKIASLENRGDVGGCSQLAIFVKKNHVQRGSNRDQHSKSMVKPYNHIASIEFPFYNEPLKSTPEILQELMEICTNLYYRSLMNSSARVTEPKQGYTLSCKSLWAVLRTRQLVKTRDNLDRIVQCEKGQEVFGRGVSGELVCLFDIPPLIYEDVVDDIFEEIVEETKDDWIDVPAVQSPSDWSGWGEPEFLSSDTSGW